MSLSLGELIAYVGVDDSKVGSGLQGAESKVESFGSRMSGIMKGIGAAAGAAVATALAVGISTNMSMETANATLQAQLGTTGKVSQQAGKVAGDLYSSAYGESLGEVSNAVRLVMQNVSGMSNASAADLKKITAEAMSLSNTFGQDLAQTTRAIDQLIRTGLASSAGEALDILTRGFQVGNDEAGDLLDTVAEYSTQFRKLGIDGTMSMGLISQGLKNGARDADIVADAFGEFSKRAVDGSALTAAGFQMIGLNAKDMANKIATGGPTAAAALDLTLDRLRGIKDPVLQAQAAFNLFGTQSEDLGAALYALDPSTATAALGQVGGAAEKMDKVVGDTAENRLKSFQRSAQMTIAKVSELPGGLGTAGAAVVTYGGSFLTTVAPIGAMIAAQRAAAAAATASGAAQSRGAIMASLAWAGAAAKATASAAVVAAVWTASAARAVASTIASVAVVVAGWTLMGLRALLAAAQIALAWLISLGPIGVVIAIVAAVVALIILNWDRIKSVTIATWEAIKNVISAVWNFIVTAVTTYVNMVWTVISTVWNIIVAVITAYLNAIKTVVTAVWNFIVAAIQGSVNIIKGIINWFGGLAGMFSGWFNGAKNAAVGVFESLVSWVSGLPGRIKGALGSLGGILTDAGRALMNGFFDGIKSVWEKIKDTVSSMGSWIKDHKGPKAYDLALLVPAGNWIMDGLERGLTQGQARVESKVLGVASSISNAMRTGIPQSALLGQNSSMKSVMGGQPAPTIHIEHYQEAEGGNARRTSEELYMLITARGGGIG